MAVALYLDHSFVDMVAVGSKLFSSMDVVNGYYRNSHHVVPKWFHSAAETAPDPSVVRESPHPPQLTSGFDLALDESGDLPL